MARLLMLAPQLPHPPSLLDGLAQGTTIRNFHLLAGLSQRHTVDLLTFAAADTDRQFESSRPLRDYCRKVIVETPPKRSLAERGRDTLLDRRPDMGLRLESPQMHRALAKLMEEQTYEIVQVEGIEMAPYALSLRAKSPAEGMQRPLLVFDDHNAEYLLQRRAFTTDVRRPRRWLGAVYSCIQWQKLVRYERIVCAAADRVVAVSENDRVALERLSPGLRVSVVPNGVDLEFYRPGCVPPHPDLTPHALVFTGKMDYRPNVDAALWFADDVLPRIRSEAPDAHFWVVGQRPHARLNRLVGRPDVTLTGRVPDVRPYIAGAGVYVAPLRIGGGTRLKVLEALAMGQAIVSTRLGCDGFKLVSGEQIRFADDSGAFADAVLALLRDRDAAAALGRAGRRFVEAQYGWEALTPLLEAVYR